MTKNRCCIFAAALLLTLSATAFATGPLHQTDTASGLEVPELLVPAGIQPEPEVRSALDALLYEYSAFELPLAEIDRQVREQGRLKIHLGNQTFDLVLEPSDLRGEGYREVLVTAVGEIEVPERPLSTFKGAVAGDPTSIVRLSVLPNLFEGYIKTDEEWIFIDPLSNYESKDGLRRETDGVVVYREDDVRPAAMGKCGAGNIEHEAHRLGLTLGASQDLSSIFEGSHVRRTLEVATDGDGQLFQRYGNPGVFNFMAGVLNRVDGLYNTLNIDVVVAFQQAWSSVSGDPYTSLSASTTLNQLQNWWQNNRGNINRDTVHQFSGKNFSGGTIGIAFVGVVCNAPSFAYGLSEDQGNATLNGRLTAHELGHNLSASHDDQIGCATCNGTGPIMCSFIQTSGTNSWSSCSRSSIGNHVDSNGFCM